MGSLRGRIAAGAFRATAVCTLLALLVSGIAATPERIGTAGASWKITSIKARSFEQATATFSDATSSSANSPLKWILVIVTAKGDTDGFTALHKVGLTATEGGKIVFARSTKPGFFRLDESGKFRGPVLDRRRAMRPAQADRANRRRQGRRNEFDGKLRLQRVAAYSRIASIIRTPACRRGNRRHQPMSLRIGLESSRSGPLYTRI